MNLGKWLLPKAAGGLTRMATPGQTTTWDRMEAPQFIKRLLGLKDPRRAANLVADGVVKARNGDTAGALRAYREAIAADEGYALGHLNIALALQDQFNDLRAGLSDEEQVAALQQMDAALKKACSLDASLMPAWRARGYVARALGDFVDARLAFSTYLAGTDEKDPHRERLSAAFAEVNDKAALQEALQSGLAMVENAATASASEIAEAEARLLFVTQKEPERAQPWWALGVLKRRDTSVPAQKKAQEYLERALEADRQFIPAHKELSSLHFLAGAPEKALPHARAAYEADPASSALVCNLGVCHLAMGQLDEAREFITLARNMAGRDAIVMDAYKALEEALRQAGVGPRR